MPPHSATPSGTSTSSTWLLAILAVGIVATRLWNLDSDPPAWMPDASIMDEALWADGARGKALFGDWFADDTGNAWLTAPVYNLLVWASYSACGVSLWSTRIVPAVCSLVLLAFVVRFARQHLGARGGRCVAVVLGLCPFLWVHSRFGLLEVPQTMCIAASFVLLFGRTPTGVPRAVTAGLVMALAVGVKPNTAVFGVAPLAAAWLVRWWQCQSPAHHVRDGLAAIVGGAAGLACLALFVWMPDPQAWLDTWKHEGGLATKSWTERLLRLGFAGSREVSSGRHGLWGPLRTAPLLTTLAWLYLVHTTLRVGSASVPWRQRLTAWEWPIVAWLLAAFTASELSYASPARRAVHLVVPMALLGATWWVGRRSRGSESAHPTEPGPLGRAALWAVLSLPVAAAAKPAIANAIGSQLRPILGTTSNPTLAAGAGGLLFLAAWVAATLGLGRTGLRPARLAEVLLRRAALPLLLALAITEAWLVGQHLLHPRFTILEAQRAVQAQIDEGEVVFGHSAAVLVQGKRVRAIRWVTATGPNYAGPRPNPDAVDRLQPRYVITHVDPADRAAEPAYDALIRNTDAQNGPRYEPILHVQYCIEPGGYPRWILQLWRRIN